MNHVTRPAPILVLLLGLTAAASDTGDAVETADAVRVDHWAAFTLWGLDP